MCSCTLRSFVVLMIAQTCSSQTLQRGPPQFENKTMLLDSYIPAAMQILAYLTELMKYDLRPPTTPPYGPTTTSTMRPTPSHRPAIFAPPKPPGPNAYFDSLKKGKNREFDSNCQEV
ncbi:hypothetical protein JTB14_010697 [Gonioctena quinquepunctata]|nr:hypothetical protein JTB14_010697 [Gonioctena quinquepunctata]